MGWRGCVEDGRGLVSGKVGKKDIVPRFFATHLFLGPGSGSFLPVHPSSHLAKTSCAGLGLVFLPPGSLRRRRVGLNRPTSL
jgi:hypothetical protein